MQDSMLLEMVIGQTGHRTDDAHQEEGGIATS
jgi:hypothetical protein